MKTNVKKILMVLPVMIVLITSLVVPIGASAAKIEDLSLNYPKLTSFKENSYFNRLSEEELAAEGYYFYINESRSDGKISNNYSFCSSGDILSAISSGKCGKTANGYWYMNISVDKSLTCRYSAVSYVSGSFVSGGAKYSQFVVVYDYVNNKALYYYGDVEVDEIESTDFDDKYTNYQAVETNITDYPDFWEIMGMPDPNGLNVDVTFTPALSGEVDRAHVSNGVTSMDKSFKMTVTNNSAKSIQYYMYIISVDNYEKYGDTVSWAIPPTETSRSVTTTAAGSSESVTTTSTNSNLRSQVDSKSFIYYSTAWVYSHGIESEAAFWDDRDVKKYNKSTAWHYVKSGDSDEQVFNWSQINIDDNTKYMVVVKAILTDYDIASDKLVSLATVEQIYSEYKMLDRDKLETVYSSTFWVKDLSDVPYDPNDTSNGLTPWSSSADTQHSAFSYNAVTSENGITDYVSKDAYTDSNSWYNLQKASIGFYSRSSSNSYVSDTFEQLDFSEYFSFLNGCFAILPNGLLALISFGFLTIVVIGIIKAVTR